MKSKSETIQLKMNEAKTTSNGLKIEWLKNEFDSSQPFNKNPKISAPAISKSSYELKVNYKSKERQFELSNGVGMITNETEIFENFSITLLEAKVLQNQMVLFLKIDKIK